MEKVKQLSAKISALPWKLWYYISLLFGILSGFFLGFSITAFIVRTSTSMLVLSIVFLVLGVICGIVCLFFFILHAIWLKGNHAKENYGKLESGQFD